MPFEIIRERDPYEKQRSKTTEMYVLFFCSRLVCNVVRCYTFRNKKKISLQIEMKLDSSSSSSFYLCNETRRCEDSFSIRSRSTIANQRSTSRRFVSLFFSFIDLIIISVENDICGSNLSFIIELSTEVKNDASVLHVQNAK